MFSRKSFLFAALLVTSSLFSQEAAPAPVRARDLGIPFVGVPGPLDAITDVAGVEVRAFEAGLQFGCSGLVVDDRGNDFVHGLFHG